MKNYLPKKANQHEKDGCSRFQKYSFFYKSLKLYSYNDNK